MCCRSSAYKDTLVSSVKSYLIRQCLRIEFLFTGQVGSVWDKVDSLVGDVNKVHIDISPKLSLTLNKKSLLFNVLISLAK